MSGAGLALGTTSPRRGDRRRTLITPEGIALPVKLASRGTRFGALLIDLTIIVLTLVLSSLALFFIAGKVFQMSGTSLDKASPQLQSALQFLAIFYLALLHDLGGDGFVCPGHHQPAQHRQLARQRN